MIPGSFEGSLVLSQLKCAGMPSVLKLMRSGFPSRSVKISIKISFSFRIVFAELYAMYKAGLPPKFVNFEPRFFCKVSLCFHFSN